MDPLIGSLEAARLIEVSSWTLNRWADDGLIPCERSPGGHRRYRYSDLLQFKKKAEVPVKKKVQSDLTISEAAEIVGLSIFLLQQLANEGKIPCTRNKNGHRLFKYEDLAAYKEKA